jgi:hypothetical protein
VNAEAAIGWVTDDLEDEASDEVEAQRDFLALITERRAGT